MKLLDFWKTESLRFDAILFDIDGTLVYGPRPLPGAASFLQQLRSDRVPFRFLTNDGDHTLEQKCSYLNRAGIAAEADEIISCLSVLPEFAARHGWERRKLFAIGKHGTVSGVALERDLAQIDSCSGILMGEGNYDWRPYWEAAVDFFRLHPERPFIVPNPDAYWPNAVTGGIGIGAGGQARCIQLLLELAGIKVEPVYLGKPHPAIYDHAARQLGLSDRSRVLCIGDSLKSDICGANRAGMVSALVLTGITSRREAEAAYGDEHPRFIFESIA